MMLEMAGERQTMRGVVEDLVFLGLEFGEESCEQPMRSDSDNSVSIWIIGQALRFEHFIRAIIPG